MQRPKRYNVIIIMPFVNPSFYSGFNHTTHTLPPHCRTIAEYDIEIEGDPGQEMIVFGSWEPYAYIKTEYDQWVEYKAQQKKAKLEERVRNEALRKKNALEFNLNLNVPVAWSPEPKEVLSGLTANSSCNGLKRNSVYHIFFREDYQEGRLKRSKGDFLCSQSKSRYGANWSGTLGDSPKTYKVTCKQCLRMVERWKKNA